MSFGLHHIRRLPRHVRFASTAPSGAKAGVSRAKGIAYSTVAVVVGGAAIAYYADSRSLVHRYVFAPILRTVLDGETAHKLALRVLRSGLAPRDQLEDDGILRVKLWDHQLSNPLGLAAGFDKDGEAIDPLFDLGFSWAEIGSVTPQPQAGNAAPRVFHLHEDQAVINRYGFPSKGATSVVARLHARLPYPFTSNAATSTPPGEARHLASMRENKLLSINLGRNKSSPPDSISDFLQGLRIFAPLSDVLVVNVSSPNTPGLRSMQSRGLLTELLVALVKERASLFKLDDSNSRHPPKLVLKVAPDLSKEELEDVAEAVLESGIDGVIVSNTTIKRPDSLRSANRSEIGGLSGPPMKPFALQALRTLRSLLPSSVPLIGCGGISSGEDAIEYARAGATMVQLYTSFSHNGVGTPRRIKDETTKILRGEGKTWMDVVEEGQKNAKPLATLARKIGTKELPAQIADRAGKTIAAGEDLLGVLKSDTGAKAPG